MGKTRSMDQLNNFLQKATKLINNTRIIKNIYKLPLYNDEPKIFAYSAFYKTRYKHNSDVASGFSFNKKTALVKVLGEGIERYCLDNFNKKDLYKGQLKNIKFGYLDPLNLSCFSKEQLKHAKFKIFKVIKTSKFQWIKATSLIEKKIVLIPAQLAIFNYRMTKKEPTILLSNSTGVAEGLTLDDALYAGICEVIERDAFMINYLNKLSSPRVDLDSINDKEIENIIKKLSRYKLELIVLELTTDLQIPAFAALILDRTKQGPSVTLGLKAGFDIKKTIIGAIEESLMVRSWIRDKFIYTDPTYKRKKEITDIEDRAHFWFPTEAIKHLNFWIHNNNIKKINIKKISIPVDKLGEALSLLKRKKMEVAYVDITDKKIKAYGFVVVKIIIPQLHPLYLDERYPYLGGERLYNAPVSMEILQSPKKESELNKIPHPFL